MLTARAFWIASPGHGEIRDESLPAPGPDDVVVRTDYSGISRGTEALVFRGGVPVSEAQRMRAPFQAGEFPAPVKYGYAAVGFVERGPAELRNRYVFVLHPHQTRFVVPATAVHVVPDSLPPQRAVLAANMETAVNGLWDAAVTPGERLTIVGAGTVGCLLAWLASRTAQCKVELVDTNPQRAVVATALGVAFAPPEQARPGARVVVHTSASEAGLRRSLELAAADGVIVEMSWFGDRQVSLPLGEAFHSKRLTIRASQVGSIPPARRAQWTFEKRMGLALDFLQDPVLDALITGESTFDELPAVMERLSEHPGNTLCHRIRYF